MRRNFLNSFLFFLTLLIHQKAMSVESPFLDLNIMKMKITHYVDEGASNEEIAQTVVEFLSMFGDPSDFKDFHSSEKASAEMQARFEGVMKMAAAISGKVIGDYVPLVRENEELIEAHYDSGERQESPEFSGGTDVPPSSGGPHFFDQTLPPAGPGAGPFISCFDDIGRQSTLANLPDFIEQLSHYALVGAQDFLTAILQDVVRETLIAHLSAAEDQVVPSLPMKTVRHEADHFVSKAPKTLAPSGQNHRFLQQTFMDLRFVPSKGASYLCIAMMLMMYLGLSGSVPQSQSISLTLAMRPVRTRFIK